MYEEIRTAINQKDLLSRHLGITVEEIREGYARAVMPCDERHRNGLGNVHGGASFALADMAFAGVVLSEGMATVNISSSISFINAGTCGPVTAEARLISRSRKLCTVEVSIADGTGTPIARFLGTGYNTGKKYLDLP